MALQDDSASASDPSVRTFEASHNLLNSSTFLLHLIEPVRIFTPPSPSSGNLAGASRSKGGSTEDRNSSEKLKRRLIDALAFICATEREGDIGAAVCIEEPAVGHTEDSGSLSSEHGDYTLRIAKNGWVGEEVLQGLRDIMKSLEAFADGSPSSSPSVTPAANLYQNTDAQVYSTIITLHLSKILYHLSEIREPITLVQEALNQHIAAGEDEPQRIAALSTLTVSETKKLQTWLRSFVSQVIAADEAGEKRIPINAVSAAYQVRRSPIFGHLETLCKSVGCQVVGAHMMKLGRYKAASRTLMHACQKWPGMFVGMKVEGVPEVEDDVVPNFTLLPRPTREQEIRRTIAELIHGDDVVAEEAAVEESVQALLPTISEEQFATAWASRVSPYTGHAEIRLMEFYDENTKSRPISGSTDPSESEVRYIGMSKKPCYLCQLFVDRHPARYMLGGLEGEKPGMGVKRILDPCWRLRPVGGENYARILDEIRDVVEKELRAEVERWVSRGSDEEVLGRERPRGRARAKGKRVSKRGKPKLQPETSTSSSDGGGMSLTVDGVNGDVSHTATASPTPAPVTTEEKTIEPTANITSVAQDHDPAVISDDEGEGAGVKLEHNEDHPAPSQAQDADQHPSQQNGEAEEARAAVASTEEPDVPDLILPTVELGSDDAVLSSPPPVAFAASPPLPNLLDYDPEFLPFNFAITSAADMPFFSNIPPSTTDNQSPPLSPSSAEFHSETQFLEESVEFKLLSPIPEEDEGLVLVNLDAVFVRLADLEAQETGKISSENTKSATGFPQRARAMSDAERDLLGLDFMVITADETQDTNTFVGDSEETNNIAPGGYLIPGDQEEETSVAPGGYFVIDSGVESQDVASRGYFVVASEQAGVTLPGGYFAAEAKMKEAGAFAPGGYFVAEMKGEVATSTLIAEESVEEDLPSGLISNEEVPSVDVGDEPGKVVPGGYLLSSQNEEMLVAPGGYFIAMSQQGDLAAPADELANGGSRQDAVQITGTTDASVEPTHTEGASSENDRDEGCDVDGYDVINMEQERRKSSSAQAQERIDVAGSRDMEVERSDNRAGISGAGMQENQCPPEVTISQKSSPLPNPPSAPSSPIIVPTLEKLSSVDAGSPATLAATSLGSSPSSSTHTTLSTGTTLANTSHPTTPRLRSSASLLFSPRLQRASTWASATTATTITLTPAITSSISVDNLTLDSRPGTAGGDLEEGKSIDIKPVKSGGWFAKRLMRTTTTTNIENLVTQDDGTNGMRRRGSFSSLRSTTTNGNALSGTAKALMTLKGLQAQVRQKQ